jgi:choline monooxygenase
MLTPDADIRRAWTPPAELYRSERWFNAAREKVFARSWQFVGDSDMVRLRGDIRPLTLLEGFLDEPLLLTRAEDGEIRCLSNVCTHRGNLVAAQPASRCRTLRCAYHGRKFDLEGRFQSMPEFEQAENFPSPADNLARVPFGTWGPLLFASANPAMPLEEWLGPVRERVGWLPLEEFRFDAARSRDYLVRANWALYCENYLEGFHIPFVHASLNEVLAYGDYNTELYEWSNLQLGIGAGGEDCFDLPASSPDRGKRVAAYYYWLFPNLMLNFYPWGLSINVVRPLAVDRTKVSFLTYVWKPDLLDRGAGADLDRVEREDENIVESVQRGLRSRFYDRGRYSPTREQGPASFPPAARTGSRRRKRRPIGVSRKDAKTTKKKDRKEEKKEWGFGVGDWPGKTRNLVEAENLPNSAFLEAPKGRQFVAGDRPKRERREPPALEKCLFGRGRSFYFRSQLRSSNWFYFIRFFHQ